MRQVRKRMSLNIYSLPGFGRKQVNMYYTSSRMVMPVTPQEFYLIEPVAIRQGIALTGNSMTGFQQAFTKTYCFSHI